MTALMETTIPHLLMNDCISLASVLVNLPKNIINILETNSVNQGFSQNFESGRPQLAIVILWLSYFSREAKIYSEYNHKLVFTLYN